MFGAFITSVTPETHHNVDGRRAAPWGHWSLVIITVSSLSLSLTRTTSSKWTSVTCSGSLRLFHTDSLRHESLKNTESGTQWPLAVYERQSQWDTAVRRRSHEKPLMSRSHSVTEGSASPKACWTQFGKDPRMDYCFWRVRFSPIQ